jgi:hypothetical protein
LQGRLSCKDAKDVIVTSNSSTSTERLRPYESAIAPVSGFRETIVTLQLPTFATQSQSADSKVVNEARLDNFSQRAILTVGADAVRVREGLGQMS